MSAWNIYHKDGSKLTDVNGEQITVHGLEYSDSWMGECFLTINFKHEVPINFQIGDYIVYRGERFELNYEPGKDKQARPDTYGEGFVYDSVKFNALQDELARAEFLDVVLNDNELHYTALPKFPFYVQTLDDLLDRIQACLNEQIGAGLWKIYSRNKDRSVQRGALESEWLSVYGEKTDDNVIESMSITVDSQTCWQALALVNEKWDINFIVRGRNIYVGTTGIQANHIFKYGLGNGLYEIVQNADSDQSVVTRLRAYGSEKNLPSHYYADLGVKYVANITKVVGASTNVTLELDLDYIETYFKNPRKYIVSGETGEQSFGWVLKVTFDFKTEITGYVTQTYDSKKCRFYSELKGTQTDTGDEESKEKLDAFIAQVKAGNTKMYITSGLNKKAVPSSMKEYAKNLPNNMSINRLMLPGFPHVSLSDFYNSLTNEEKKYVNPTGRQHKFSTDPHRPYIDSINIEQIGLRSASQFFETDDKTNGVIEIYPTIEEMEIGGVRVDEIDEGVAPDDDGRFGDNETVKNVDIYLKKAIDFDINDLKDDDFSISMKDGMCGGRTFKVASSAKIDGRWRLTIERVKDDALELWFPYKDYPIKNGDHFVLTGITLPDSYVNAASLKLLKYAIAFIDKNDYTRYVYQPKVDEIFMARQHDLAEKDTTGVIKSLHDTLKAGDLMEFEDTDLRIGGVISIDQLTIKEEDGKIPTYDITLREDKEVGTIQKIQQQISSLQSGNGGTGAGLTTTQVKGQIATEGSKHFISKINDDIANGTITWEKVQKLLSGLLIGNSNNENGGSWTPDEEGRSHLITDYLEVRMKAIFEELVINKTSTIGGKEIISPAGGVVAHKVEEVTVTYNNVSQKAYRCYFLAEQDGDEVDNDFAVNDQVRSESFNVRKGNYHKAGNHFYWRLVIGRDEDPVELEGKKYHYIDLSDTDCATASDVPAKGDVLNQCGNRTDIERQNCLIFSAVDTYSPSISLYHGINSYSFANREYVEYGVNKQNNKAFFNVYGDMYVGDRPTKENGYEGSSYIRYDSSTKQLSVKGKISAKSTVDGKELSQYFNKIAELQNQVDGAIETWFYDGVPTLENAPAISWKTDKDKEIHLGDLYYNNKTGKAYRFAKDSNTYKWTLITDTDIAKALSDARMAQETANGKMKVFSVQPTTPYQVGDIWVNATYPSDGSTYKNEVLRCQTNKAAGSQFAIGDWIKASKYTDDTVANAAKKAAEDAQKAAQTAQKDITNLEKTVTDNKKEFDNYVTDGYLEPSEIAAMAQDSKRLEDDFAAAQKSYNEVKGAEVLKDTKELTDLTSAFATLTTAKTELVTDLSDISKRYNETDTNGKAAIVSAVGTKFTNFQSAYSAFYDKLGLANAYITSKIYGDLKQNITDLAGYKYLKDALGQTTDIDGGLVMTTLLALRDGDGNVQSGINGAIDPNRGKKSIATWWGGQMVDKDYNSGNLTPATSLIRFDGSGYLANGAIWWDVSGKVHADPTSFIISEKNLGAYLIFFEPTWKEGSAGTSVADLVSLKPNAPFSKLGVSGDATFEGAISFHGIKLTYDSTNKAIKIDGNLYATGGITAYGAGASTTGGGGGLNGSVKSYSNALKLTSESLSEIASAYSIKALDSRISSLEGGSATAISVSGSGNAVTSVTKNGTTISVVKGSTFLTSHQSLDGYVNAISVSGSGNAITSVSKSGKGITFTKGATFLTSHQSLANYYTKSSVDSLLSGKSATSHTHSVKINGVTKTIAATGGTAVDLGTYLTSHQSLANYVTIHDSRLSDNRYPKFANDTWYLVGEDVYIGDHNIGGTFCIKSAHNVNVSGIAIYNSDETKVAKLWFDNTNINLDKQLVMNNKRIWIQGVGTAGGNNNRLTLVAGMPSGLAYNTSCRGTILYSNGIAFADPYNGNSNNDSGWIRHLETSANSGTLEIAVGDDASNEQIHFRWYNTNSSAETIAHDITVPRATGTLALTSQIPTTLPANGGNADKLDGYHANGLLTALSNSDKGISITVGGTTKSISNISVNYASSAGNADTVDGYQVNGSNVAPYGHIPSIENDGVMKVGKYIDFHNDNSGKHDFSTRLQTTGNYGNSVNLPSASGTLALTTDNVASAAKLQTPRTIWGQSFDGTGNVNGTIYINNSDSENGAIILNNNVNTHARISAIKDQVVFNTGAAIRFGATNWEYSDWAGLKYDTVANAIYLGIADGTVFNYCSNKRSNGTLKFPGITTITPDSGARIGGSGADLFLGNANNSAWVKVQDICSQTNSSLWSIRQDGNAYFKNIYSGAATINGNLSVDGLISNKGILPANYEFNNKGTSCYVSADALCSGITAITDSIQINQVTVQYSNDSGNSWTNYPMGNDAKFNLYASNAGLTQVYLGYNVITGNNDAEKLAQVKKNELMVTFEISNNCYSQVYFASVDISNGIDTICTVECLNNSGAVVRTYTKHVTGWNQVNYINISEGNAGYGLGSDYNRYIRFRFKHDQKTTALRNTVINKIRIFSFTKYSFPTDRFMGHTGHIYNFDYNMNTYFPNSILAKGGVTAYQSSDIRLKQDLRKLDYLGIIKAMGGTFGFAWKKDNTRSIGWIAQHVLCNPHLKDIVETDEKGYYKINYWSPKLIATAFGAIEQVGDEVSRLKARVVFLESEVQRLSGDKDGNNKKRLDNKNINSLN
nr:MAG: Prophage endopeptidase tail [Bacteriophage sp.]